MGLNIINFGKLEREYFCCEDWTGLPCLSPLAKFRSDENGFSAPPIAAQADIWVHSADSVRRSADLRPPRAV